MIEKLLRAIRNARAAIAMALFMALMRYVLHHLEKSHSQPEDADLRPEAIPAYKQKQIRRPAFLS
jgi:hypothetical protein